MGCWKCKTCGNTWCDIDECYICFKESLKVLKSTKIKRTTHFEDLDTALAQTDGGWLFLKKDGTVEWLCHNHTVSEVLRRPGEGTIEKRNTVFDRMYGEVADSLQKHEIHTKGNPYVYESDQKIKF